jgi:serine phosphatase RsbU (regulator of sigma subunit)
LRDTRASRHHARILEEDGAYVIEDLASKHGVTVNGERVRRRALRPGDVIRFGFEQSDELTFAVEAPELGRLLESLPAAAAPVPPAAQNLIKLRAVLEVARALQSSLSIDDVLAAVLDAALTITGTERGFLLLKEGEELGIRVARDASGMSLPKDALQVPTRLIHRALRERRELLSMNFDPFGGGQRPDASVANLELRSVVTVPLVRVRTSDPGETMTTSLNETVGLIYLDSRRGAADLSSGNRELLQSLAIEASTILENARLLEQERARQALEEELRIARLIQQSLLPDRLPASGWFRAAGSSIASHQVGGDYFDAIQIGPDAWSAVVADVCGKGVSSALLAALLQGAALRSARAPAEIEQMLAQLNRFLLERTQGEKYATLFYAVIRSDGELEWANAAHCAPLLVRRSGAVEPLEPTSLPVGLLESAAYEVKRERLAPEDKLDIYTDGFTEARNEQGQFFETARLLRLVREHARVSCAALHALLIEELQRFTGGAPQNDDVTLLVVEYRPDDI